MPDVIRSLPKQVINVVPTGAGVAEMKETYAKLADSDVGLRLVLLIGCANVANLLLARSATRRGQTARRLAVGASSQQIAREALIEHPPRVRGGAIAGPLVGVAAARLLLALAFHRMQFLPISTAPAFTVLAFACALALVTGILFGTAPWLAMRTDPVDALCGAGRGSIPHSSFASKALLVVQATLSVVLVAGASMLARSLSKFEHQDLGYPVQGRGLVEFETPPSTYTQPKLAPLYRAMEERLNRLPGVRASGLALYNPLTNIWGELIMVAGHPSRGAEFGLRDRDSAWPRLFHRG
jgi:hypothetical protein